MVRELRPLEAARQTEDDSLKREVDSLAQQRQEQLDKIESIKKELTELGITEEQIERATKKGSAFCTVM